jgi:hypothetical protein
MRRLKSIDSAELLADPQIAMDDTRYRSGGLKRWPKAPRFKNKDGSVTVMLTYSGTMDDGCKITVRKKLRYTFAREATNHPVQR